MKYSKINEAKLEDIIARYRKDSIAKFLFNTRYVVYIFRNGNIA